MWTSILLITLLVVGLIVLLRTGPIDVLSAEVNSKVKWVAQDSISGFRSIQSSHEIDQNKAFTTGTATADGANQIYTSLTTIAASGSLSVDLTSFTNVVNLTASFARVKWIRIRLLAAAQKAADGSTAGTACSSITVGNSGANDFINQAAGPGWLGAAAHTMVIPNGGSLTFETSGATGVLVDATHKIIKVLNNDAAVSAVVEVIIGGADA